MHQRHRSVRQVRHTDEITKFVVFLASDDSSYMTGTELMWRRHGTSVMTPFGNAKKKPSYCEKRRSKDRGQPGFVVLLVMLGLLKIASAEPRSRVPEQLQYLEEPNRGEWQMPERVIGALRLQKSDVVADVGAGTGYFSRRFARQVAHVYAEDVDPEALSFLRREALAKVTVVPGKPENPMLPPNS